MVATCDMVFIFVDTVGYLVSVYQLFKIVQNIVLASLIDISKITFFYHQDNELIGVTSKSVLKYLNLTQPVTIMVHGFKENASTTLIIAMGSAYAKYKDVNFLTVDWSDYTINYPYLRAVEVVPEVGDLVGNFIYNISTSVTISIFQNIHLIGYSLGAHVAGFAGKYIYKLTTMRIDRVTGLDVARPLFTFPIRRLCKNRLCKTDAEFVDVIHTNILGFGATFPIGQADFYVNKGGPIQPGCVKNVFRNYINDEPWSKL